jgi:hypothetical protein
LWNNVFQLDYDFERQLIAYDQCNDGSRNDACASNPVCSKQTGTFPRGVIEFWDTEANINCLAMGFDFGWKTGDPGCFNEAVSPFHADGSSLGSTEARSCPNWDCSLPPTAVYSVACSTPEGAQFKEADITSNIDMHIYVKAKGGYLYEYKAGETLHVVTPGGKAISHIEFCFLCPKATDAPTKVILVVVRDTPSEMKFS